jgi:prepilin signal peptidase PulO-like enzyme (type II secretory pathway)
MLVLLALFSISLTLGAIVLVQKNYGRNWRIALTLIILITLPTWFYVYDSSRDRGSIGDFAGAVVLYLGVVAPSCVAAILSLIWYLPWSRWLGSKGK